MMTDVKPVNCSPSDDFSSDKKIFPRRSSKNFVNYDENSSVPNYRHGKTWKLANEMCKSKTDTGYPAVVVRKKMWVNYVYRLPSDNTKCYKFHMKRVNILSNYSNLYCTGCSLLNQHARNTGKPVITAHSIKSDLFSMFEDPTVGHIPGCEPFVYEDVLKGCARDQEVQREPSPSGSFPLERVRKVDEYSVLYRFNDSDSTPMCYRFHLRRRVPNGDCGYTSVVCIACSSLRHKTQKNRKRSILESNDLHQSTSTIRCTLYGFLRDPQLFHRNDCKPQKYSDVMKKFEIVDEKTAREFLCADNTEEDGESENLNISSKKERLSIDTIIKSSEKPTADIICTSSRRSYRLSIQNNQNTSGDVSHLDDNELFVETDESMLDDFNTFDETSGCSMIDEDLPISQVNDHLANCTSDLQTDESSKLPSQVDAELNSSATPVEGLQINEKDAQIEISENKPETKNEPADICEPAQKRIKIENDDDGDVMIIEPPVLRNRTTIPKSVRVEPNQIEEKPQADEPIVTKNVNNEQRTIPVQVTQDFTKVFDTSIFNVNEVSVSIIGQKVTVAFLKEAGSSGVTTNLSYSLVLPDSVDPSTIRTAWQPGQLILTGQRK